MKRILLTLAAFGLVASGAGHTRAGPIDYVVSTTKQFGTLDLQTGVFTQTGTADVHLQDMARLPGGPLYGVDDFSNLRIIDPNTATSTVVGPMGQRILAVKLRQDGTMFELSVAGNLFTIDKSTGAATLVGASGILSSFYDMAFDSSNHLFVASIPNSGGVNSTLYSVDTTTAAATPVGLVGFRNSVLDFENGTLYGFTDDNPRSTISINTSTGAGTAVAPQDPLLTTVFGAATTAGASAVPEPASLALAGLGGLGLLGYRWRRRSRRLPDPAAGGAS